jgi:hypothetical protein
MMLYVNGQDIRRLTLGLLHQDSEPVLETYQCSPEEFLKRIDTFFKEHGMTVDDVDQIITVKGPGSATSLRSILSIINTLGFFKGVKVAGVEKELETLDKDVINSILNESVELDYSETILPKYSHGPRITISKKDQLGQSAKSK